MLYVVWLSLHVDLRITYVTVVSAYTEHMLRYLLTRSLHETAFPQNELPRSESLNLTKKTHTIHHPCRLEELGDLRDAADRLPPLQNRPLLTLISDEEATLFRAFNLLAGPLKVREPSACRSFPTHVGTTRLGLFRVVV